MRYSHTLFAVLFLLLALCPAFADNVHQHGYEEVDYDTYPVEMMGSYIRVQTWLQNTQTEIDNIMLSTDPRVITWRNAILAVPMDSDRKMLDHINAITNNSILYVDDFDHYHKDYWAPPIETLTNGGDCEDIALLKAVALHLKRWDDDNAANSMHLLVGLMNQNNKTVPHAALEVDTADDEHYVMNNLTDSIVTFDTMNLRMKPLYMMDATGVIAFVKSAHSLASIAASAGSKDGETVPIDWDSRNIEWDDEYSRK